MNMNTNINIWDIEINDTELLENKNIFERWIERNTTLNIDEISILIHILDKVKGRLGFFYKVNDVLEDKIDEYMDEEIGAMVTKTYSKYKIETSVGTLKLSYEHLKSVVARIIDIYSIYLPLGTVVEVAAQDVKNVFPVEGEEDVKLIIVGRMVQFSDKLMNTYTGVVYPLSNLGRYTFTINFTNKNIKRIVDLGYEDEMDKDYLLFTKKEMIIDKNIHSLDMIDKFEREELSSCMR